MNLIATEDGKEYLSVKSTLMKKPSPKQEVLLSLKKKFTDAGCECCLEKNKQQTTLVINYNNIVTMQQYTRPVA